jgi:hypothetical protein
MSLEQKGNKRSLSARPPSGLSRVDYALMGSEEATRDVVGAHPELGQRSTSGLSTIEWAQMGLQSAERKVREITS